MDWLPLNFQLMASPINWIIIILMLVLAVAGFKIIAPATSLPQ